MIWLALVLVTAVLGGGGTVWLVAREHRWRWGTVRGAPVDVGAGPYREATTCARLPRGVPRPVRWAAGTAVAWGVLTLLVFMPAGFLLLLAIGDASVSGSAWAGLGAMMLLLVACDGLILGFALLAVAPRLLRGGEEGTRSAQGVAWWSTLHHFVVIATFVVFALASGEGIVLLVLSIVPCLVGLGQAGLLDRASEICAEAEPG